MSVFCLSGDPEMRSILPWFSHSVAPHVLGSRGQKFEFIKCFLLIKRKPLIGEVVSVIQPRKVYTGHRWYD